jgi:hypothetical protein
MQARSPLLFLTALLMGSCTILLDAPHETLSDGFYTRTIPGAENQEVYLHWDDDVLRLFRPRQPLADPLEILPEGKPDVTETEVTLVQPSFDLDFMTILFKYRPKTSGLPRQLNSDLSGALYVGYRRDVFNIHYEEALPQLHHRRISHFGYSAGFFTGFGATAMNPWVTNEQLIQEYEGVVWSNGLAAIIGVNQFSLGLALGWDMLLDENRDYWIYNGKPWFGLTLGLNLN